MAIYSKFCTFKLFTMKYWKNGLGVKHFGGCETFFPMVYTNYCFFPSKVIACVILLNNFYFIFAIKLFILVSLMQTVPIFEVIYYIAEHEIWGQLNVPKFKI